MSGYVANYNRNSAFKGYLSNGKYFSGRYSFPSKRYYDKYSYGTDGSWHTRGKLGDATKETRTNYNWYSDYDVFVNESNPWVVRGGSYNDGASAGAFNFGCNIGSASIGYSTRAVISNLN